MKNTFTTPWGNFNLCCSGHDPTMQAWNQADSYLLNVLAEQKEYANTGIATINDQFGALSVATSAFNPAIYNDSAIFSHWLEKNWPGDLSVPATLPVHLLENARQKTFLMQIPKNLQFFRHELSLLSRLDDITVMVAGMQKHWPKSFYQTAYDYFSEVTVLPGVKKAKCMILRDGKKSSAPEAAQALCFADHGITVLNYPNVFSREGLDIGTRFFLENFPDLGDCEYIIDLACGNGILGIKALQLFSTLRAGFIDESFYATLSCRGSLEANHILPERFQVIQNDCLFNLELPPADAILCNPPFHQQHRISDNLSMTMIQQSRNQLKKNGKLFLIGNRHLQYHIPLNKSFSRVSVIAANEKFTLYQAIK